MTGYRSMWLFMTYLQIMNSGMLLMPMHMLLRLWACLQAVGIPLKWNLALHVFMAVIWNCRRAAQTLSLRALHFRRQEQRWDC